MRYSRATVTTLKMLGWFVIVSSLCSSSANAYIHKPLKCTVTCIEDSIRLQNPNALTSSSLPAYDLIKDQVSRGIVELCVADKFGSICDNGWGDMDASVVCRQLGFSPNGAIALPGYIFGGSASRDSEYSCVGSEDKLASCPYQPAANTSCGRAGVVCQGEDVYTNFVYFTP